MDEERVFVNGSRLPDALCVLMAEHFEVTSDDSLVAQNAANLIVPIDRDAPAVRQFQSGRVPSPQASPQGFSICFGGPESSHGKEK